MGSCFPHGVFCPLSVITFWPTVWDPAPPHQLFAPFLYLHSDPLFGILLPPWCFLPPFCNYVLTHCLGPCSPTPAFCPLPVLTFWPTVWDPAPPWWLFAPFLYLHSDPLFGILLPTPAFCPLPVLTFWPTVWDPAPPHQLFAPFLYLHSDPLFGILLPHDGFLPPSCTYVLTHCLGSCSPHGGFLPPSSIGLMTLSDLRLFRDEEAIVPIKLTLSAAGQTISSCQNIRKCKLSWPFNFANPIARSLVETFYIFTRPVPDFYV